MSDLNTRFVVTILGFNHALSSAITGALDIFALAGVSWQRIHKQAANPRFHVQLATFNGLPITCTNQLVLTPHVAIEDVKNTHVLLIPTIGGDIEEVVQDNKHLQIFIKQHFHQGADIAANCTGNFLLAEAGVLNNATATTHWGYADLFSAKYPHIPLTPDKMITQHNNVYCAGGGVAWFDLALLIIERYCGHQVATDTAKAHVLDLNRTSQQAYASTRQRKFHQDEAILKAQEYIEDHYGHPIGLADMAKTANLTERTFSRRFKQATGQSPGQYLQTIRIEQARKILETQNWPLEKIVQEVGYDDLSSFSRLFKKNCGLSPSQYRLKFTRSYF